MIPRSTIEAIREKVDIVELVESKGVTLKRVGFRMVGLCPVHQERTPSFNVNASSGSFKCFGCGIGGDAIAFLMEVDSYTFSGAVEELGSMVGIEVIDDAGEDPDYQRKKDYIRTVGAASWFYRTRFAELPMEHPAKQDLSRRDYLEVEGRDEWLQDFGMGYAPGGGDALCGFLRAQGYSHEQILDAGLAFENERTGRLRDRFRDRLLWEIRDLRGRPIGFSGRRMNEEDNPKYLNTPETILYHKSNVLYGIDLARKKMTEDKTAFVVEGAADVMAVAATGYTNTVASCGTGFGVGHASIIRRIIDDFNSKDNGKFVFVFDGDAAGMKAASKMFDLKPSIKERSYVAELDGLDPVDFRVQFGDDELRKRLEKPLPITEFMLRRVASKYDLSEIESRSAFVREAMTLISHIEEPDIFEAYKRKISAMSGVSVHHLRGGRNPEQHAPEAYEQPGFTGLEYPEEPEDYDYYDDSLPPDDGGQLPPDYEDPFTGVQTAPKPQPSHNPGEDARARTGGLLIACLLQYPLQTFNVLRKNPDVAFFIRSHSQQNFLIEGMSKAGPTASRGETTVLKPSDFTDSDGSIQYFHAILDTEEARAEKFVERLVSNLAGIEAKSKAEELRASIALGAVDEKDVLAKMLAERKNRK